MGRAIWSKFTDDVFLGKTCTVQTGTEDPDYPAANLVNGIPTLPAQLTTTSGAWLIDLGAATRVDIVGCTIDNIDPGVTVRVQMNATDSWGAPTVNGLVSIPNRRADGFPPGWWIDLTQVAGYSAGGFRYVRLVISTVNSEAVKVGSLHGLTVKRVLNPNVSWPVRLPEDHPIVENMTPYKVATIYDRGTVIRSLSASRDVSDAILAETMEWFRGAAGRAKAFGFIPDESVNEFWLARFGSAMMDPTQQVVDRNDIQITVQEVGRGLVLQND